MFHNSFAINRFGTLSENCRVSPSNSHSETRFRPSRFLCNLDISALNSVFFPSTLNLQLSTFFPSRDPSSQPLTNCPPHNLFLLTSLQMPGGIGDRVQEFLKHYFNCGRISGRLNLLQEVNFKGHRSRITVHLKDYLNCLGTPAEKRSLANTFERNCSEGPPSVPTSLRQR